MTAHLKLNARAAQQRRPISFPELIFSHAICYLSLVSGIHLQMLGLDDSVLLKEYVEHGSEEAFATLVARHVNKVYSIALRHTRNAHQAEEITQAVFVLLARKSRQLEKRVILSGWLCRTARLSAVTFVRSETRRTRREQEAHMQNLLNESEAEVWPQIAPLLDAAMAGLSEADHDAVALRFFDGKSMKEIGAALGASEDATKMRVNRAVEKLRVFFTRRGIVCSAAALTAAISANAVQAAPVGLAVSVSTAAVAGTTIAATASAATIKTIAMTTLQKVLITATIIAVGVATPWVIQHQAKLRKENARTLSAPSQEEASIPAIAASENDFPRESWAFKGYATPESALVSLVWTAVNSDVEGFLNSLSPEQQSRVRLRWQRQGLGTDQAQIRNSVSNQFGPITRFRILNKEILSEGEVILRLQMVGEKGGTGTVGKKVQRIGNEWKIGATL